MLSPVSVIMVLTTLTAVCKSAHPTVKVENNSTAVLPCFKTCSGEVSWKVRSKPSHILATCDRIFCRSVKEGYQMIHHQYLQGDLSLIITGADFRKRDWYMSSCEGEHLCDVALKIEPLKTDVQVRAGGSLWLELDVSDPVEVIYSRTHPANGSSVRICTVDGGSLQSKPEYDQRTSLSSALELRGLKVSDSGVYLIRDTRNVENIHIYTVSVCDGDSDQSGQTQKVRKSVLSPPSGDGACGAAWSAWVFAAVLGIVCVVCVCVCVVCVCVVCVVCVGVIVRLCCKVQQLQSESVKKEDPEIGGLRTTSNDQELI